MKNNKGFTLMEVLVTTILVGVLSALCAMMLVYSFNMFEKIYNQKNASVDYKQLRVRLEQTLMKMTVEGAVLTDIINNESDIMMDYDFYVLTPAGTYVGITDSARVVPDQHTTKYRVNSSSINAGAWAGFGGKINFFLQFSKR